MPREEAPHAAGLVLIDTSVWIAALDPAGDDGCRRQVSALLTSRRAATCEIVVAEVLRGAEDDREAQLLEERLRSLVRLSMDGVGAVAAAMGRKMGTPRQRLADLLVAAVAFAHDVALLHRDRHLAQIAERFRIPQTPA